jgi:hypothetical protein
MNATRFSCYSLAVKGFSAFSGANHAPSNGGLALLLRSTRLVAAVAEFGSLGVTVAVEL